MILTFTSIFLSVIIFMGSSNKKMKILMIPFFMSLISLVFFFELVDLSISSLDFQMDLSLSFLTLGVWMPTLFSSFQKNFMNKQDLFFTLLFFLGLVLLALFLSKNLLVFFLFFELSVIPIILIMFLGGSSKNKGEAGIFLFFFTSFSAFFLLIFISYFSNYYSGDMNWMNSLGYNSVFYGFNEILYCLELNVFLKMIFLSTFMVKMPIFFLHMWLPKAHVEAPVFGSMILASIMLKLGGFGVHLFVNLILKNDLIPFLMFFSIYSAMLAAFSCYSQKDLKIIIALSSVNHMTFFFLSIISLNSQAVWGGLVLMLGHGVISSLMFFFSSISYSQISTRSIFFSKNFGSNFTISMIWLIIIFINSGLPPFINFVGEISILKIFIKDPILLSFCLMNFLMIGLYGVLMLSHLTGSKNHKNNLNSLGSLKEGIVYSIALMHFLLLYSFSSIVSIFI